MTAEFTINNYVLGAQLKMTPVGKIIKQERIDRYHTLIQYENLTENEVRFIEKVLSYKAKII